MPSLRVIALISGGKDSLFSILHCLANGHHVVALANLHPPLSPSTSGDDATAEEDDINSYMYQTVGHSIIPLYEKALEIPLYRQQILGSALNKDRDYAAPIVNPASGPQSDETESLVPLLESVLRDHPDANAICTGAILSTYQRTRVESVALRLNLISLSYLWQYPFLPPYSQSALLHDMGAVGQDARIIKVASGGIDESFLSLNVADPRTIFRLGKAVGRFGGNADGAVLGEGGEFETLSLNGPGVLWKKRIEIDFEGAVVGEGGNACVRWGEAKVVERDAVDRSSDLRNLRIPEMWDDEFAKMKSLIMEDLEVGVPKLTQPIVTDLGNSSSTSGFERFMLRTSRTDAFVTISNIHENPHANQDPSAQLTTILANLRNQLDLQNLPLSSVVHTTLLLRSMSTFNSLNSIYSQAFTTPNPPSRVTVACGDVMPEGIDVMLSVVADNSRQRRGLHVQSRSYWAPANIGPYSQAISCPIPKEEENLDDEPPRAVFVAGQIPLVPATMEVVGGEGETEMTGFATQVTLALQHLWRIGRAMEVGWWTAGVAYISDCTPQEGRQRARIAQAAWKTIHGVSKDDAGNSDEEGEVDIWDLKHGVAVDYSKGDKTIRHPLPDYESLEGMPFTPPCFVVQVKELPRAVDVEWWSIGLANSRAIPGITEDLLEWETEILGTTRRFLSVELPEEGFDSSDMEATINRLFDYQSYWDHCTVFASPALPRKILDARPSSAQTVPCKRVFGANGKSVAGVVIGRCYHNGV